jgi:hypothetical protein
MKSLYSPVIAGIAILILLFVFSNMQMISITVFHWSLPFVIVFSLLMAVMNFFSSQPQTPSSYVTKFMGTILVKLFSALIFLTIALYMNKGWEMRDKLTLSGIVFGTYVLFTIMMGKSQSAKP